MVPQTGVVKWFNSTKGYGFITPTGGGDDIFVHFSSIKKSGTKELKTGGEVSYDLIQGEKGLQALNVTTLSEGVKS